MPQDPFMLEICVDSLESACAAERGGANRIELCSALVEGGITPSAGLLTMVRKKLSIGICMMVRPRGGDFLYSDLEFEQMREEIRLAKGEGADGVVLGILDRNGRVDVARTQQLVELAAPLPVIFHRAIDMTPNLIESLEDVIATGADRILTSGGLNSVSQAIDTIAALVQKAGSRITIMPGSGIRPDNIALLAESTGAREFHASARTTYPSPMLFRKPGVCLSDVPERDFLNHVADEETVRRLSRELQCSAQHGVTSL